MKLNSYGIEKVVGAVSSDPKAYWPAVIRRTYFEQSALREFLCTVLKDMRVGQAVEFGCGYGRMLPVLTEFAESVTGLERDEELALIAASLKYPGTTVKQVSELSDCDLADHSVDLVLTYTVMQHLTLVECQKTFAEMRRVLRLTGVIVLCEDTGTGEGQDYTRRSVEEYKNLAGLRLIHTAPRLFENGQPMGDYMAFRT